MRLKHIKLSGFKSFVDPTTVSFPSHLSGVVGPNGCGKSNIIDAVRWVMGESSAKHLRGESMADVIFNGASGRKPVGQATVELVFDNTEGKLSGEYSSYSEICIRRVVNREAQSTYYLNNTRCRRRDIMDIFRGTGLGPRSYAIIEQGMISRLIEAKPEELRFYLEEAAGVTKYKDRRRETELRIEHTRANLARLSDVREELGVQLERLQRQAKAAEKYKELKVEERTFTAQLHSMRWNILNKDVEQQQQNVNLCAVEYERCAAEHTHTLTQIEQARTVYTDLNDELQQRQAQYYSASSEVGRIEQEINHLKQRRQTLQVDLNDVEKRLQNAQELTIADKETITRCEAALADNTPKLEELQHSLMQAQSVLEQAEQALNQSQQEWDALQQQIGQQQKHSELLRVQIQHADEQIAQYRERINKLTAEKQTLDVSDLLIEQEVIEEKLQLHIQRNEQFAADIESKTTQLTQQQQTNTQLRQEVHQLRVLLQQEQGQHASLLALQNAALGHDNQPLTDWLQQQQLMQKPRLAQGMKVTKGWETAVECVLREFLPAVVIDELNSVGDNANNLPGHLSVYAKESHPATQTSRAGLTALRQHIQSDWPLLGLLAGVYCADSLDAALKQRAQLEAHESFITPEGIWVGKDWLRVHHAEDAQSGVLQRQQNLTELEQQIAQHTQQAEEMTHALQSGEQQVIAWDQEREQMRKTYQELHRDYAALQAKLHECATKIQHANQRSQVVAQELEDLHQRAQMSAEQLATCRNEQQGTHDQLEQGIGAQQLLNQKRENARVHLREARNQVDEQREKSHQFTVQVNTLKNELNAATTSLTRAEHQLRDLHMRQQQLEEAIENCSQPLSTLEEQLNTALELRVTKEEALNRARDELASIEKQVRELEQLQTQQARAMESARAAVEESRVTLATTETRRANVAEQLAALEVNIAETLELLPPEANESAWAEELEAIGQRIKRLGAINLAAIEEFTAATERKEYLDSQCADVQEALDILEQAIQKIDQETRETFKQTYNTINDHLANLFPQIFGGGEAYLELTDEDILTAGVRIVARPPGKRNSSIHLLSGGEKALTAIALVFSFFKLHPSPFCMLDEVDAPLDDANVARFCQLVKQMSSKVQFIVITHNKVTMEMVEHLTGVTQRELGVSRLVSVDMEEATALVAS